MENLLITDNIILMSDSYKFSHHLQLQPKTTNTYSYFESRGGRFPATTFFGLQYYIKKYLVGRVVTQEKIEEAQSYVDPHFGIKRIFNREGWELIANKFDGKLPVIIKSVLEGTTVPYSNVLVTIELTEEAQATGQLAWLVNFLETLLVEIWYPITVATLSREIKKVISDYLTVTGGIEGVNFKLHDFGFRGVSSPESAAIGGAAHLINFLGTDTMVANVLARKFYGEHMAGFSIPASEHSTITSWGKAREAQAMANMLEQFKDCPLVACVSDSYDIFNACANIWGDVLKEKVLNHNGTLVIRPDSGDPENVIAKVMDILGAKFGYENNRQGYKVLNPHVRVIQGDGVNYDSIKAILQRMKVNGWSAANIAFGMGGALLQKLDRDTQRFAFKCSETTVDGESIEVYKDPITDKGKRSKSGRLRLVKVGNTGEYTTLPEGVSVETDHLVEVFRGGELLIDQKMSEIRERAAL